MEREFWLTRWENDEIGFHQTQVNPWLLEHWSKLGLSPGSTVFVPLCGKSLDLGWLARQGHQVIGVELAETAVRAWFQEANEPYQVQRLTHLQCFSGGGVVIYCGDFMDLWVQHLPRVAAVYDRASLIALPPKTRAIYADHLQRIIPEGCQILLLTLEFDQHKVQGPPHSVEHSEVQALFGARCRVDRLCVRTVTQLPPKFAAGGVPEALEVAYRLVKKT